MVTGMVIAAVMGIPTLEALAMMATALAVTVTVMATALTVMEATATVRGK
jgi:hypothetical protein